MLTIPVYVPFVPYVCTTGLVGFVTTTPLAHVQLVTVNHVTGVNVPVTVSAAAPAVGLQFML